MACETCGADTERGWKFCPKCGTELRRKNFLEYGMADVFAGLAANIAKKLLFDMQPQGGKSDGAFAVRVMQGPVQGFGFPNMNFSGETGHSKKKIAELGAPAKVRPAPKETIEPKAEFNKMPGKLIVEVDAPGVKSLDDVDVLEMGTSVEVRAYSGETLYFKIISVPKKSSVLSKKVEDGKVVLEMSG